MFPYRLDFYSIKDNNNVVKYFDNKIDFQRLYKALLGHTYIKDLVCYKYDSKMHIYKECRL